MYSRIGRTYSPISGKEVKRHSADDVVKYISSLPSGSKVIILSPLTLPHKIDARTFFGFIVQQGFTRVLNPDGDIVRIDGEEIEYLPGEDEKFHIIVDRLSSSNKADDLSRYADSIETAFTSGSGHCDIGVFKGKNLSIENFSIKFESDGIVFEEPSEHLFSFNNPLGACPVCEGYSKIIGIDEDLVIPDQNLSIYEDAIACWKGEKMKKWKERLVMSADKFNFPIHKPWHKLSDEDKSLIWTGNKYFYGLNKFFDYLEEKKYKIQYRVMLSRYRGKTTCPECKGNRLKKEAGYVKICKKPIWDMTNMPVGDLLSFISEIKLKKSEYEVAERILIEIESRLKFLNDVGLSYLTLNRLSSSLSGGESQRINLATSLGSNLVGSLYILDEPSIGLHPRDTHLLIDVLKELRDIGNTVLVVEHEEEIIRKADRLIDIGPEAGRLGGEVVFDGPPENVKDGKSLTCDYLTGKLSIPLPSIRRKWNSYIDIKGARENNLKDQEERFPLNTITLVTGVSGSGKSSLVSTILYPALKNAIEGFGSKPGKHSDISGDINSLDAVEMVDQNPIGRSSRSNPVTYLKAFDEIRRLYADQQLSKQNGYKASHFSFNVDGGRCEECLGEGTIKVEMQFMADVQLVCDSCKGQRFKKDILEVKYNEKNIYDVLEMTINESIEFFSETNGKTESKIIKKLTPLADVGLGYIKLGQSSSTLSGGESQRVKLAYYLSLERNDQNILFIFDEPTTGLHFHDINKLLKSLNALVERGHSVILIEHNVEMIKNGDWIIDLGPEGGENGGEVLFAGTPEDLIKCKDSYTGKFLKKKL